MRAILYVGFLIVALVKAQGGVVSTYYDDTCRDAIGTWTFELGECYNHPMLEGGISVGSFPACESGVPSLSVSDNANCEIPSVAISFYDTVVDSCYYLSGTAGMASAKFFCDISNSGSGSTGGSSTSEISTPTSTTTSFESLPTTVTTSITSRETPTVTESSSTSKSASTTATSTSSSQPANSSNSSSALSLSDKIALGIGLGVGIPGLIIPIVFGIRHWKKTGGDVFHIHK